MHYFWELVKISFKRQVTYRAATLAGLATNLFFGLLRVAVLIALYGERTSVEGISIQEAISYTGLAQAIIAYLSLFNWFDIALSVYQGDIASDLLKPVSFFSYWLARDFGRAIAQLLMRGIPIMLAYAIIFDIDVPSGLVWWLAFLVSLVLAWMVSFGWRFLVNLSAFWTPNAIGFSRFFFMLSWFLSGFLMPLRFLPDWFVRICYLTPFPYSVNTVLEVYLGIIEPGELLAALFGQFIWVIILIFMGHLTMRAGIKRLIILGG